MASTAERCVVVVDADHLPAVHPPVGPGAPEAPPHLGLERQAQVGAPVDEAKAERRLQLLWKMRTWPRWVCSRVAKPLSNSERRACTSVRLSSLKARSAK